MIDPFQLLVLVAFVCIMVWIIKTLNAKSRRHQQAEEARIRQEQERQQASYLKVLKEPTAPEIHVAFEALTDLANDCAAKFAAYPLAACGKSTTVAN
jgi:hypothetical protein